MPSITVKNIPTELYELLKQAASTHRRSINSEIIFCIEQAVRSQKASPQGFLAGARILREKSAEYEISDEEFSQAKGAGRP
jgi:plasmid stability protein